MESAASGDFSLASTFALKVALQTMKERCVALQRRLASVEGENKQLRELANENQSTRGNGNGNGGGIAAELFQLRSKVAEMQRQKNQMTEHISIVSAENQKLWSRLSQIAKEQERNITAKDNDRTLTNDNEAEEMTPRPLGGVNQNLIRSKTFTQHSPNPNLRHKMVVSASTEEAREVSLDDKGLQDGSKKDTGAGDEFAEHCEGSAVLGFAYLNADEDVTEDEMGPETKKCIEHLKDIHREALRQQQILKSTFTKLSNRATSRPCSDCLKKLQKPEMADKSLETDDSLSEPRFEAKGQLQTRTHNKPENDFPEILTSSAPPLNIINDKIKADAMDKTCPMCGNIYSSAVSFDEFREHVEMHFVDDMSDETSLDRNFEIVAHTVGDF